MLRITIKGNRQAVVLHLEGRLEGPWVAVLTKCWQRTLHKLQGRTLRVDLNGVIFVDAQGKARLAEIYAQGAELLGEDLETQAMVAEIQSGAARAADNKPSQIPQRKAVANDAEKLAKLQTLEAELHQVNEEFANAARPLERIDELNEEQRRQLASDLRARLSGWESVTHEIRQVMGTEGANDRPHPNSNESGSR